MNIVKNKIVLQEDGHERGFVKQFTATKKREEFCFCNFCLDEFVRCELMERVVNSAKNKIVMLLQKEGHKFAGGNDVS